jgi:glycosyltransferase involved in cell wall biosynthesis
LSSELVKPISDISICFTTGTDSELVVATIESILAQKGVNLEVVIQLDEHDAEIFERCLKYSEKDSRLVLHRGTESCGQLAALNKAISLSSFDYLCILQPGDTFIDPTALRQMSDVLTRDAKVMVVSSGYQLLSSSKKIISEMPPQYTHESDFSDFDVLKNSATGTFLPPLVSHLFRRSNKQILLQEPLHSLASLVFVKDISGQIDNATFFGIEKCLVAIRYFDYVESYNRAQESLVRLGEFARLSLSASSTNDAMTALWQLCTERTGVNLFEQNLAAASPAMRALDIYLDGATRKNAQFAVGSLCLLTLNRIERKRYLENAHKDTKLELDRLEKEIRSLTESKQRIVDSRTWRIADKLRSIVRRSKVDN